MTDQTLNLFLSRGTNAARTAFTPSPPTPASGASYTYFWHETDTDNSYAWNGTVWKQVNTTLDAELVAIAGLVSAADRLPYFTGSGTASLATFTAAGRALVDDADAAAQRVTLGLVIGTDVQAYSANLTTFAGIAPSANVQTLLGAADFAAFRSSLGIGSIGLLSTVTEADQTLADNTTNNASTAKHGFLKKLSNTATEYMDGTGNWSVPAGGGGGVSDGDKGDIVVSGSGTVWTIDTTGVSAGTYQSVTVNTKGQVTAGTGFRGALVTKAANQTGANYSAAPKVAWDAEDYDTDAFHDNVTNNTRLTVPSGVTKVRLAGGVELANCAGASFMGINLFKNNASFLGQPQQMISTHATAARLSLASPVVRVVAGDYFELSLNCSDTSVDVIKDASWFSIEVVE